jgi:hypothetical protein
MTPEFSSTAGPIERRRHARVSFTPFQRPHFLLPIGRHDVLDACLCGLRILHTSPARPAVGTRITGTLEWIHGEPPLSVTGTIVRVERNDFVIACEPGTIPLGYLPWAAQ